MFCDHVSYAACQIIVHETHALANLSFKPVSFPRPWRSPNSGGCDFQGPGPAQKSLQLSLWPIGFRGKKLTKLTCDDGQGVRHPNCKTSSESLDVGRVETSRICYWCPDPTAGLCLELVPVELIHLVQVC